MLHPSQYALGVAAAGGAALAVETRAAGNAVLLELASGRKIRVPTGGEAIFDSLRNSREPVAGKDRFNDVVAGYFVVAGLDDPGILNSVIKNVAAYTSIFGKEYPYSFYEKTRSLPTAPFADRFAANHADVRAGLAPCRTAIAR